jgi:hypothetical protein
MEEQIQEILKILKILENFKNEQDLVNKTLIVNYQGLTANYQGLTANYQGLKNDQEGIKNIIKSEQILNESRYRELKSSLDKTATKEQLTQVFEALSDDMIPLHSGQAQLKKRVAQHERRLNKIESNMA